MKKWISVLFLCLISFNFIFSQKYKKQQFTLFKYNCIVDQNIISNFAPLEVYMNCNPPKAYTKTEMMFVQAVYSTVKNKMEEKYGLYILPVGSFGDKISYTVFGFPDILINTAIKKGNSKYYFKINASIQNSPKLKENSDELMPLVKIQIDLFTKDGYQPIKSTEGISEAAGMMEKKGSILDGVECVQLSEEQKNTSRGEVLQTLINDAVEMALKKL